MTPRVVLLTLLLLGTGIGQQEEPVILTPGGQVPICRGKANDAPDCVTPPHTTYAPDPKYPDKARKAHDRGSVVLQLIVGTNGRPRDLKVDRGFTPELDKAALDAVKRWEFVPANRGGNPVAAQIKVEVTFNVY